MKTRLWLHILLFVITLFTTIVAGASFRNVPLQTGTTTNCYIDPRTQRPVCTFNGTSTNQIVKVAQAGAPFAVSLLLILGIHEMGHYIAARRHKIAVTPPYFIPMPVEGSLGTMGAVIMIRSPLTNRKMLFDVGISGPLAGFVVAVIVLLISFSMPIGSRNTIFSGMQLGMPLLVEWMIHLFRPDIRNLSTFVGNNPVALAAWFGMFLTALNLLPIGQLDGGHIMYALFGRKAWTVAIIAAAILIFLGLTGSVFLIIYVVMAYMTGLRHPPPHNDITPLDAKRKWLGYATIVLFFLLATPRPFTTAPVLQLIHIMFG